MAKTGTYFTTGTPTATEALMAQWQTRVRIGTQNLYGSLETTSDLYTNYGASIGLINGQSYDIGLLESIGLELTAEKEEYEAANVISSGIFFVTEETAVLSLGLKEFDPRTLQLCVTNGILRELGDERLYTIGSATGQNVNRPIEIASENIFQSAPSSPGDTEIGISAMVMTIYDTECTSGLPLSDIIAGELNTVDLEFSARPVAGNDNGNKLMNIYIF